MKKLGFITIGQSPRNDVVPEIIEFLEKDVQIFEEGALDYASPEEIAKMYPREGDYVLVSTLRDGSCVKIAEKHIIEKLQKAIESLQSKDVEVITLICTGTFPNVFVSKVPLIYPQKIMHSLVPHLTSTKKVAVIIPDEAQILQTVQKWESLGLKVRVVAYSPYKNSEDISKLSELASCKDIDIIIMDCIGYKTKMKDKVKMLTGKPVILGRSLVARVLGEML